MAESTREAELLACIAELEHRLSLQQSGSGAVAAGAQAAAAGAGGVAVVGDVRGNVYVGAVPQDDAEALRIYRRVLVAGCRRLPLRGVDVGASDPTGSQMQMDLDQVYVALDTTARLSGGYRRTSTATGTDVSQLEDEAPLPVAPKKKGRVPRIGDKVGFIQLPPPLTSVEAVAQWRHVVILGDPGSGKSTFLNHLGLCLAGHGLDPKSGWLHRLRGWPEKEGDLLPVSVVLRDFCRQLPEKAGGAEAHHLWDFIAQRLKTQNLEFCAEPLSRLLDGGKVIVLLDGLDEVPSTALRSFVRDAVVAFTTRYAQSRVVVTCRTLAYQDARWRVPAREKATREDGIGFKDFTLAPFNGRKIDQFIGAWFGDLQSLGVIKAEDAPALTRGLRVAIRRPDLWRLAPNPLLLTVMALVHTHKGRLPDARAMLYEDAVDILLWRWEQIKLGADGSAKGLRTLLSEARRSEVDLKRTLWRLAFEVHGQAGAEDKLADIGELTLQRALRDLHPERDLGWAGQVLETIKLRAGLLIERQPEVYTFPHRTFQEYLAGAHLASQAAFAREAPKLVESGAYWREVIRLAVGRLVYLSGDTDKPLSLVAELCPTTRERTDAGWRQAWLAGEVLDEVGLARSGESALGREFLQRVRERLAELVSTGALTPVERAAAGTVLGRLGDARPGVGVKDGIPDIEWLGVPAGPFLMGRTRDVSVPSETPQFTCNLIQRPYRISKYPVTVAQYQAFVVVGGYQQRRWWTDAGWVWNELQESRGPEEYEPIYQTANHPRVGVCWFEATAYCRWLSEVMRRVIRLPSEAEWEKAARHVDGRDYPWGSREESAHRCNMQNTGIGHTSSVGMFPNGGAVCGASDMAGNVLEWCRTKWCKDYRDYERQVDDEPEGDEVRMLRGGSWSGVRSGVRCADRYCYVPFNRDMDIGFRVVSSPF